jgi:hypothetical protein
MDYGLSYLLLFAEGVVFLQPKKEFSEDSTSVNRDQGVFSSKCLTLLSVNGGL